MASNRMSKRTPTKSIKSNNRHRHHNRRHHRKNFTPKCSSAATAAAASIFASLNRSIFTCHRRLLRLFSKLARIGTPSSSNRCTKGFKILKDQYLDPEPEPELRSIGSNSIITPRKLSFFDNEDSLLPPLKKEEKNKKTIFLDLDETLVHSTQQPPAVRVDFVVRPKIEGEVMTFFVVKRPGVDEFLEKIGAKYEVVVFTAGLREYASLVLDRLDRKHVISHRLYRDSCREIDGKLVKDLSATGREMGSVVIVDDNPNAYALQPENAVPIKQFVDDLKDRELGKLVEFFEGCDEVEDMKVAVKEFVAKGEINNSML